MFCPFCHDCAWDVWSRTVTAGDGLRSWQRTVCGPSPCGIAVGWEHRKKSSLLKDLAVFGIPPTPAPASGTRVLGALEAVTVSTPFRLGVCHLVATVFLNKVRTIPQLRLPAAQTFPWHRLGRRQRQRKLTDISQLCCPSTYQPSDI